MQYIYIGLALIIRLVGCLEINGDGHGHLVDLDMGLLWTLNSRPLLRHRQMDPWSLSTARGKLSLTKCAFTMQPAGTSAV